LLCTAGVAATELQESEEITLKEWQDLTERMLCLWSMVKVSKKDQLEKKQVLPGDCLWGWSMT